MSGGTGMRDGSDPFRVVHGSVRDATTNAFAIVKNEMYYVRSFLDHHRKIGVEQFIIVDDHSGDGTREFLVAQPDCVVLESPLSFGEQVSVPGLCGGQPMRAGIAFKSLIPQTFLAGRYALYLDADEYLVLPAGVNSLGALLDMLSLNDVVSVAGSLVDFFPASVTEMDVPRDLPTSEAMLGAHTYFDAAPIIGFEPGRAGVVELDDNASARLFRKHRVKTIPESMMRAPRWLNRLLPFAYPTTSVLKTPVVRWDPGVEYLNSHRASVAPSEKVLLGLAHLKFTYDLARRIEYALESKAYVRGSRKYLWYAELLESMRQGDPSFLGPKSKRYQGPADFAAAGITRLDLA